MGVTPHQERTHYGQQTMNETSAVASFGMLLRASPFKGDAQYEKTLTWAKESLGPDKDSLRAELVTLVEKARRLRRE